MRTHNCSELNIKDIDKKVSLCGWVHRRRDHGKLIFIDIRDRNGITQIVFHSKINLDAYNKANELRPEFVIAVTGKVSRRPAATENPKIPTGQVEVAAESLEILNSSNTTPFEIDDDMEISEELRLKYRYLDMRRQKVYKNLTLRNKLYKIIRAVLDKEGFIEVETPILTKSTPEGARDYLVPSRLNPGEFFALPQSPQLFKQILMVGGLEKYFQIAKCFRDEDLRADRQPEFTQLDIEMSFVDEEDIFAISEKIFSAVFKELKNIEIPTPFKRMAHKEAMEKYKSDKPDLRTNKEGFELVWVTDFPLFKYNLDEKKWESEHHPFTALHKDDVGLLSSGQLDKIRSRSYDLVINGIEIGSGSIRIHQEQIQKKIFNIIGISEEEAKERFGFLLDAFTYGAPPHGGVAFGLDRLLAILASVDSIREVIFFPKTQKAICPLTNAPSPVKKEQLKELGITILKGGNK